MSLLQWLNQFGLTSDWTPLNVVLSAVIIMGLTCCFDLFTSIFKRR